MINYAYIHTPVNNMTKSINHTPSHHLICKINSWSDMGHLERTIKFENNIKYLENYNQIKEDMLKFWNNNIYNLIKIRTEIHDGFGFRFFELIDSNKKSIKKTFKYQNVMIDLIITHT